MKMIQRVKMRLMKRTALSKQFCWMLFLIFDLKVDFFTISSPCFIFQHLLSQSSWKPPNFITFFLT